MDTVCDHDGLLATRALVVESCLRETWRPRLDNTALSASNTSTVAFAFSTNESRRLDLRSKRAKTSGVFLRARPNFVRFLAFVPLKAVGFFCARLLFRTRDVLSSVLRTRL